MSDKLAIVIAATCGLLTGGSAFADRPRAALEYYQLCVFEGFLFEPTKQPLGFGGATPIAPNTLLQTLPNDIPLKVFSAWDLSPGGPPGEGAAIVAATFEHPTMGRMPGCIMMLEHGEAGAIEAELFKLGAERDGKFIFANGPRFLWMMTVSSDAEGLTLIMGFAPQE